MKIVILILRNTDPGTCQMAGPQIFSSWLPLLAPNCVWNVFGGGTFGTAGRRTPRPFCFSWSRKAYARGGGISVRSSHRGSVLVVTRAGAVGSVRRDPEVG